MPEAIKANYNLTSWVDSKNYALNDLVVYDNKIYRANKNVNPSANNPSVAVADWVFVTDYLPDEVERANTFEHWRMTTNQQLLAQGNQEVRLSVTEKNIENILNNDIVSDYSGTNLNLNQRFVLLENDVLNILQGSSIGSVHSPVQNGLETRLVDIEEDVTNLFTGGIDGGASLGSSHSPVLNGLETRFTRLENDVLSVLQGGNTIGDLHHPSAVSGLKDRLENIEDLINNSGFQIWKGSWIASTAYRKGDVVKNGPLNNIYVCTQNHTSSATFSADESTKWAIEVDFAGTKRLYEIKTASFNAVAGGSYFVNTVGNDVTITLPATPSIADQGIHITHIDGDLSVPGQSMVVARNGKKIMGFAQDNKLDKNFGSFSLVYSNETYGWRFTIL